MSDTLELKVTGMTCGGCENAVKRAVSRLEGVESVSASHVTQTVEVVYRPGFVNRANIAAAIDALGYQVVH